MTNALLTIQELPRDPDGAIVGMYHVRDRASGRHLEEVGERAVGTFELERLEAALGSYMTITPADADTAEACARHLYEKTKDGARAKALRALFAKPKPRGKGTKKKGGAKAAAETR